MPDNLRILREFRNYLTSITGRILQESDLRASVVLGAATKTVVGSSVASAAMGAVGALGTASTGTAIAGLAGAAKTTATLYWIGGLVGGGVAAGTLVVGAGAIGAGIYGTVKLRRAVLGASREGQISVKEEQMILAIAALVAAIDETLESGKELRAREVVLFSRLGITPLRQELMQALEQNVFSGMKAYHRARLRGHLINLRILQKRIEA